MKKIDTDTKYAIISILLFVLVFAVAFSGSMEVFRVATELKSKSQAASYSPFGVKPVKPSPYSGENIEKSGASINAIKMQLQSDVCKGKEKCKDWCATSYVTVGKNAKEPQVYTCSIFNSKRNDEIAKEILNLSNAFANLVEISRQDIENSKSQAVLNRNQASATNSFGANTKNNDNNYHGFYKLLCIYKDQQQYNENKREIIKLLSALPMKLEDKKNIMNKILKIEKLKAKWLKQPPAAKVASKDDLSKCLFKGVVNCVLTPEASQKASGLSACKSGSDSCKDAISKSDKLSGQIFACFPKNKKSESNSQQNGSSGTNSSSSVNTQNPGVNTTPQPSVQQPYGQSGYAQTNPGIMPQAPTNNNATGKQNYDPCKDPSYTTKQNMGLFSSLLFNVNCAISSKNKKDENNSNTEKQAIYPSCVLSVDSDNLKEGEKLHLTWKSSKAKSAILKQGTEIISRSIEGEIDLYPDTTQTYTLTVTSKTGQSKTCSKSVTVSENPVKLSCSPEIISKGSSVQVDWSCPAGFTLKDSNFGASGDSGLLAKTLDSSQELTVSCAKDEKILSASCFVQVANPELEIIAYPLQVGRGEKARVSWAAVQMQSCRVTGPRGFDYARNFAVALTTPFPTDDRIYSDAAIYTLECQDKWGKSYSKDVTIRLLGDLDQVEAQQNETTPEPEVIPNDEISTTIIKTSLDPKQCPHFTKYYKQGESGGEIPKIQTFLKDQGLYYGAIDGYYSEELDRAVRAFQAKYADEILKPWNLSAPTGYWYKTTRKKANYLAGCAEGAVVLDDGTVVY